MKLLLSCQWRLCSFQWTSYYSNKLLLQSTKPGFPSAGAWSWDHLELCRPRLVYRDGSEQWHAWSNISVWFHMDFIGLLFPLGWTIRGRSGFCPLGLFRGLFSNFGVRNWNLSQSHRFWFVVLGSCLWGNGIGSGSLLYGGTLTWKRGPGLAHCTYIDPLPGIDRCHDVYSVKCNIVIN